jgi:hypothetical protein
MLSYIILNIFYFIALVILVNLCKKIIINDETQKALELNSEGIFIPKNSCYNELYIDRLVNIQNNKKNNNLGDIPKYIGILPYSDRIVSKNGLWLLMKSCYSHKVLDKYFPKTFILQEWNDRTNFNAFVFNSINNQVSTLINDKNNKMNDKINNKMNDKINNKMNDKIDDKINDKINNIYILKKNINCKLGIKLFKINNKNDLSELYSTYFQEDYKLVQQFMPNPFLINNRILIIRVYIFIYKEYLLQNKQLTLYRFNWIKCLYTDKDLDTNDFSSLISNSHKINYGLPLYYNKNEELQLFKKLDNSLKMLAIASKETFLDNDILKGHNQFQIFGLDYILDQNRNPYLLEINKGPNLQNYHSNYEKKMKKMLVYQMHNLIKNKTDINNTNYDIIYQSKY